MLTRELHGPGLLWLHVGSRIGTNKSVTLNDACSHQQYKTLQMYHTCVLIMHVTWPDQAQLNPPKDGGRKPSKNIRCKIYWMATSAIVVTTLVVTTLSQEAEQHCTPDGTVHYWRWHMNMQRHTSCCIRHIRMGKDIVGTPPFLELLLRELESFVR
jgi:hypothetical protein